MFLDWKTILLNENTPPNLIYRFNRIPINIQPHFIVTGTILFYLYSCLVSCEILLPWPRPTHTNLIDEFINLTVDHCYNLQFSRSVVSNSFSSVQFNSVAQLYPTLCDPMNCSTPGLPVPQSLPKLMFIESVMPSSHLILCRPLLLLPPIPPSIRVFSNESNLGVRWPKFWSFSFSISTSNEHPGLISFRMDWLDLLAVQGTLKSLLHHHSSKASILGTQLSSQSNSHIHTRPLEKP